MSELIPALLVGAATEVDAAEVADLLVAMLSDPRLPSAMHVDLQARLRDLYRRFPTLEQQPFGPGRGFAPAGDPLG